MISVKCFLLAEYAAVTQQNQLIVSGTFNTIQNVIEKAPSDGERLAIPVSGYIVGVSEASLSDGLQHQFELRIVDGNGNAIVSKNIAVNYSLNRDGRMMNNNMRPAFWKSLASRCTSDPGEAIGYFAEKGPVPPLGCTSDWRKRATASCPRPTSPKW